MAKNNYKIWLYGKTAAELSEEIGVTRRTIFMWRAGHAPQTKHMKQIVLASKGKIDFNDILDYSIKN